MHGHQRVGFFIPVVKFANDMHALYIGRPNAKRQPRVRFCVSGCAPIFPQLRSPHTNAKQIDIVLGELRRVRGGFTGSGLLFAGFSFLYRSRWIPS